MPAAGHWDWGGKREEGGEEEKRSKEKVLHGIENRVKRVVSVWTSSVRGRRHDCRPQRAPHEFTKEEIEDERSHQSCEH